MASPSFFESLATLLPAGSRVLTDESSAEFKASMNRWTNYDLKVPSAIVQPATEEDVATAVRELVSASIPFVPSSGGHSSFSSIGKDGVVIDLSQFTGVEVDVKNGTATVVGGTLMKELQTALHPHKHFAGMFPSHETPCLRRKSTYGSIAVGSGGTVGVIPYYIGGGISAYTPFYGYGCENIVASTLVTAKGELVQVSESDTELLWGLSGAGQFLGLVTKITIKILPYSLLGNKKGERITGTFAFTVDKVDAVCAAMAPLMESKNFISAGHFSVALAPPTFQNQVLLVAPQIFATAEEAWKLFQPLINLYPFMQLVGHSTFEKHSDNFDWLRAKGSFKRFTQYGMTGFYAGNFKELVKLHAELVETCPDAAKSAFTMEWHTPYKGPRVDTAFGMDDVQYWL